MNYSIKSASLVLASSLALALAACGSEVVDADADGDGEVTQAEAAELQNSLGAEIKPEPGKYTATMEFVSLDIPGAPPQMVEMMQNVSGQNFEFCMTEEMAEQGYGEAMKEGQDDSCTISKLTIDGGDMDMAMTCNPAGTGEISVKAQGKVTPTGSEMTMISEGDFGVGEGKMEMKVTQERIGECAE